VHTKHGYSAYALAYNDTNTVHTYDIGCHVTNQLVKDKKNINFHIGESLQSQPPEQLINSALIFLNLETSDGIQEKLFYDMLCQHNYRGMLVCNKIWGNIKIRDQFWFMLSNTNRWDLTTIGHHEGTGVICFNHDYDYVFPPKISTDNWTIVTAFVDLSKCSDASSETKNIDLSTRAVMTMSCPYNLVVYSDSANLEQLKKLRPIHLQDRTRYIAVDFEDLKFTGHAGYDLFKFSTYRNLVISNRKAKPYKCDPMYTASYYLFTMLKYISLKQAMITNSFGSTHFAWLDMYHVGNMDLSRLDEALSQQRDKFSICYTDYQPLSLVNNSHDYFRLVRQGMCTGFFTGHVKYMTQICHAIEDQFLVLVGQGYGHTDEQLYDSIYFRQPELFEHYYGNPSEMVTNYCQVYNNPSDPINTFIKHCFAYQNYVKCYEACRYVWTSYVQNKCKITTDDLKTLCFYKSTSKIRIKHEGELQHLPDSIVRSPQKSKKSTIITLLYEVGHPEHIANMLAHVDQWLAMTFPIIIWTNQACYDTLKLLFADKKDVLICKREIDEFETYKYVDRIAEIQKTYVITNKNLSKDTLPYHMLMYARPQMWAESVKSNPFKTDTFICMDFGLYRFTKYLPVVEQWDIKNKLKMLLIYPYLPQDQEPKEYFRYTRHNVAGGMVTGDGANIIKFAELFDIEFKDMMHNNWYQLDEALTACVVRKHPDLCDHYYGDYNGIIANYTTINEMTNIPEMVQRYLNNRMYHHAQKIINMIDYRLSEKSMYYFVELSILTNYYTMDHCLNPIVTHILMDPTKCEMRASIESRHAGNLKFYKNPPNFSCPTITQV
jgi:hypothetical protein